MIDTMRRCLMRRRIRRWHIMHARFLLALRAEAEYRRKCWEAYNPDKNYKDRMGS